MFRRVLLLGLMLACLGSSAAAPPAWWATRGATDTNPPDDFAAVNQGQLKQFTQKAVQELNARIPGGAGPELNGLVNGWVQAYQTGGYNATNPLPTDFDAMNSGQLKWIASKVHARLVDIKYEDAPPPWLTQNLAADHQLVNLGQLKTVFNFDLTAPPGQLPEWWQKFYFNGQTGIDPIADPDSDGLTNSEELNLVSSPVDGDEDSDGLTFAQEITLGTSPGHPDSDQDGVTDWDEVVNNGTDPLQSLDQDGDGMPDDLEKHLAKQFLAVDSTSAYWGALHPSLLSGNLDPSQDYTGDLQGIGSFTSMFASIAASPFRWSQFHLEAQYKWNSVHGYLDHEPEDYPIGTYRYSTASGRDFRSLQNPGQLSTTYLSEQIAGLPYIEEQVSELLSWEYNLERGFIVSSLVDDAMPDGESTEFYASKAHRKFRVVAPRVDHESMSKSYLKCIYKQEGGLYTVGPAQLDSVETLEITLPKGRLATAWYHMEAPLIHGFLTTIHLIPVEITVAFGLGPEPVGPKNSRELLETYLETIKVSRTGDTWFVKYTDAQGVEKFHGIEIVTTKEKLIDALKRAGQKVVFDGHSNFGLGPNFSGKVTHRTIADFTHFGVGKTSIPKSFRGDGTETDVIPYTNGDGTTLPTNPQDLAAIDRVHSEGWAYLKLESGQIIETPQNYQVSDLGIERFKNLQGVAPGSTFTKQGNGFNNEWHFDNPEASRRLIVQVPSTDVPTLGYAKFFYNACNTGRDYVESFKHGDFIYTKESCKVEDATKIFVQGIVEGKSNEQIMTNLNQNGVGNAGNQSPQIYGFKPF